MKAAPRFLSAVSAAALAIAPAVGGAAAVSVLTTASAQAAVVTSISVRGNQRVSEQTIADFVGYRSGRNYSGSDINDAVRALFRSGLFANAAVVTSGSTLVVTVEEYATVNQVLFQGNRRLDDDRLRNVVELTPRSRFEQAILDADVEAIVEAYSRTGRSDVTVNASVVDLGENRVNVIFQILEGDRTKIARINFTGNNAFGDRRLQAVISTKASNPLSWLTRNDVYDDQRLAADEEALRRFYFNRGYADFRIISSSAEVDPSTGNIVINIEVDEGDRYTFGNIEIDSTVTGADTNALARTISTRSGSVYSAREVEDTLIAMSERLAGAGFPFAEVTPVGNRNFDNRTIDVTYIVDQGQRAFIERIEIVGNTRTRDYVIRREFDVSEGDAFNQVLIRRAQRRLEALDFFSTVRISTRPGSSPDRVIVVVQVEDKSTGEFGAGVGYATGGENEGVNLEGSISERNFLGRGQAIRIGIGGSTSSRTYNLSFTEPYFLGYRVSATFGLYQNRNDLGDYERTSTGGSVSFGLPLTDDLTANVGYNYQRDVYSADGTDCTDLPGDPDANCGAPAFVQGRIVSGQARIKSSVIYGLVYNTIEDRNDPRDGLFMRVNQEVAGLGGDARFIRTTADASYYMTLAEDAELIGLLRGGAGNVTGLGQSVEGFDQFEMSARRLRGFAFNGIGPRDAAGNFIGGKTYFNATAELQFPLPALPRDLGFKGAVFADAATLFGSDVAGAQNTNLEWRASAGLSVIWQSPFAPLRFDYAWPLVKEPQDDEQRFNFSVSTAF
ncbi:MAG: outer membrane protein assembly factor BamA [Roseitalea porphyridii]|jgi:outer membrane protein insertion porin family|uniref:outer membrane protein assembly factor BamA n=1 Tax=Roseitalea porphyridii TaxID=1852022 RepID=UPI0032EE0DA6